MTLQRALDLSKLLGESRSSFLFGPRGVGKTLLAREFIDRQQSGSPSITIDLLNLDNYRRYLSEPELFRLEPSAGTGVIGHGGNLPCLLP